jgi:enamine deaminase RidA (YjgF/YER057c/UK114 family)
MNFSERLAQLGLELPAPVNPLGSYRTISVSGNQLYVSGLGPFENGKPIVGTVGVDANGASDLLQALFGADKLPARSALGVYTLPMGIPVEIDSIFELKRQGAS